MKIALDWIADYLSPVPSADSAADALMNAGLPVESIADAQGWGGGVAGPTKVLDVEVTSNRTDCFCHVGLARELAVLTDGKFTMPKITIAESSTPASSLTSVAIQDLAGCPYYSARILRNVKVGPSPEWLVRRLESLGLRLVNNVVDVTNFVLMELGQPLHAFDYDALQEKRIVVRRAIKGEKMLAIDGKEYPLDPSMLLIADAQDPVAIAGVIGGKITEVTARTTNILLESARFEPLSIRTTSRALALKSDASFRFERGIDPIMAELASQRAAQLILATAAGELAQGVVTAGSINPKNLQITLRLQRFRDVVGIDIAPDRALAILSVLGFTPVKHDSATLTVDVPSHRLDVDREIDLIEEIARVHGYRHVPTLDRVTHSVKPETDREKALRAICSTLVEAGFSEAVTVTFISEDDANPFAPAGQALIHPQHGGWKSDVLRPSLLPNLLAARRTNQYAGIPDAHLFEIAATFLQTTAGSSATPPTLHAPTETRSLAAVASDLGHVTALLGLLADRLNPAMKLWVEPKDYPFYTRGASGQIYMQIGNARSILGHAGLITPDLQKKYDLRHPIAGIELALEPLLSAFQVVRRANPVSRFPGVTRDLSLVVDEAVRWADVQAAVQSAKLAQLAQVDFVTTFRNAPIGKGKKSLTLTLEFRDPARTLTSEEVDTQMKTALDLLTNKFQATLRA